MKLEQATRSNSSMRLAIFGCSGGGKTYSALQLAKGLTKNNQIAVIDTEAGSTALYSNLKSFKVLRPEQTFTPETFIDKDPFVITPQTGIRIKEWCNQTPTNNNNHELYRNPTITNTFQ